MKILWLTPYPINLLEEELGLKKNVSGHPCSWVVNLANELNKNDKIEFHILTLSAAIKENKSFKKNNITFHVLKHKFPFLRKGFPNFFPLDTILGYIEIKYKIIDYIDSIKPDIIHIHGTEGAYASILKDINMPVLISIQGVINKIYEVDPTLKGYFQKQIELNAIKYGKHFGCRTEWDKTFVKNLNARASIYYLPEAINYSFFNKQWEPQPKNNKLLFIGSLIRRKGIYTLLSAIKILKEKSIYVELNIAGGNINNEDKNLIKFLNGLNIKNQVNFLGKKTSLELASMLSESTIYVHPSFIDNSPNSLAEAMAVGTPCIASSIGGIPSMIENNKNGLLFEAGNKNELAEKIELVLNENRRQKFFSENSRILARQRNFPPVVAEITLTNYRKILEEE